MLDRDLEVTAALPIPIFFQTSGEKMQCAFFHASVYIKTRPKRTEGIGQATLPLKERLLENNMYKTVTNFALRFLKKRKL